MPKLLHNRAMALLALTLLAACAGNPAVPQGASAMHTNATKADAQTMAMFRTANTQSRTISVETKLMADEADKPAIARLTEADVPLLVEPAVAAQWSAMFGALSDYTGALVKLTDPGLASSVGEGLGAVAGNVAVLANQQGMQGPLSGLLRDFGTAIASAASQRKALDIIRRTDPSFNALVVEMAQALGDSNESGLRKTVADRWNSAMLRSISERYANLTQADPAAIEHRRAVAQRYVGGLEARDAQLAEIAAIRTRLLSLARTHRELASLKEE